MPPDPAAPGYDAVPEIGLLYDNVPIYAARADVGFYLDLAAPLGSGGTDSVLDLGCGTGRITLALARGGHPVVGIDGSDRMIARCRAKLEGESSSIRSRVTLRRADIRSFDLGRRFPLAIAPFRVFQHLTTVEEQLACLDSVARHLLPGGRLVFDVFNPDFAALVAADGIERSDTAERRLPDGRSFRRAVRIPRVRWVDQVSEIELIYYVFPASGGDPARYAQSFDLRWYLRAELEHLVRRGGFRVEAIYGDFDRSPVTDHAPEQIVCAVRE